MKRFQSSIAIGLAYSVLLFSVGCGTPTTPGTPAPNAALVATYQTLITAQAALNTIRAQSAQLGPYKNQINMVLTAYNVAEGSFQTVYAGVNKDQAGLVTATAQLVVQIAALVAIIAPAAPRQVHAATVTHPTPAITLGDILGILNVAAGVASGIPGGSMYATLAQVILAAVAAALAAHDAATTVNPALLQYLPLL